MEGVASLDEVLADRVSGASEIEAHLLAALSPGALDPREVREDLPARLTTTFPHMANVLHLAQELSRLPRESPGLEEALATLVARRQEEARRRSERISHIVTPLLPEGDLLVFTISKSGTVASVLLDLHQSGRKLCVLVAESRPGGEGARLARELGDQGLRCRATDDLLLLSLVPPDAALRRPAGYVGNAVVLVGADAIHPDGLVNKVGTRALLETATRSGVPAFVLAASSKLRGDAAHRVLGSLFETIPKNGFVVLTEKGKA